MFTAHHDNRQKQNAPIATRLINRILARLDRLDRLGGQAPIDVIQTQGGPIVVLRGGVTEVAYFVPLSGPIPAATGFVPGSLELGSGKATKYYRDPQTNSLKTTGVTQTIYNWAPGQVGAANRLLICALVNGDWTVIAEACPQGGGS